MSWRGHLSLHYRLEGARTVALDRHEGPLRVLQRLYPEGEAVCHHVLVHPPGGLVGGDELEVEVQLDAGTHAVVTTPGATRFYRTSGERATQRATLHVGAGARLEWLPLETIAYQGCTGENQVQLQLHPEAQCLGWDVLALGLPAASEPFSRGSFLQHLELPGCWLERGRVQAEDTLLHDSPLGWDGQRVLGTIWLASGSAWPTAQRDALLEHARACASASPLAPRAGATAAHGQVLVLRVLGPRVEPVMALLAAVRGAWRAQAWRLPDERPRVWTT